MNKRTSVNKRTYAVVIDPGHGGPDPGVRANGVTEADLVLGIAVELATELQARGHAATLTRGATLERTKLSQRGDVSKRARADVVISLHANAAAGPDGVAIEKPAGAIVFFNPKWEQAKRLANAIDRGLPPELKAGKNHLVTPATAENWPRALNVLAVHSMPAVLLEVGFVTNPAEAEFLSRPKTTKDIVRAIADAIDATPPA